LHVDDLNDDHYNQVSSVSYEVLEVNSQEAADVFFDIMSCSNTEIEELSDTQTA
jgi:hypothetical protein